MALTTQHWIGIGGAAALLGYLLWPKKPTYASTTVPTQAAKPKSTPYTAYTPPKSYAPPTSYGTPGTSPGTSYDPAAEAAAKAAADEIARKALAAAAAAEETGSDDSGMGESGMYGSKSSDTGMGESGTTLSPADPVDLVVGTRRSAYVGNWYGNTYLPNYWRRVTG